MAKTFKAVVVERTGGPEVMQYRDVPQREPGPGEALVEVHASGVNFIDTYHRSGAYPMPTPFTPGSEGAGTVVAVGAGRSDVAVGDRVAWALERGSYAERQVVPTWKLVPVPDGVPFDRAAALMLQGMTAHYLACSTFPLDPAHTALVHAAAGGVGQLLCRIAKMRGATVIGTCSTHEKEEIAKAAGAAHTIRYTQDDFVARTRALTRGQGADVVYDSVGKTTFDGSLGSLRPRGTLVLFGQSSGAVPPVDLQLLNQHGSLYVTRPSLGHYVATREELLSRTDDLFRWLADGRLDVHIDTTFKMAEAAQAHTYIEGRKTTGKLLLVP